MKYWFFTLVSLFIAVNFISCKDHKTDENLIALDSSKSDDQIVMALLYQQKAAEYRALCLQSYNIAKMRVDAAIKNKHVYPFAVVTDLDETALDNSSNEAWLYKHDSTYTSAQFNDWCKMQKDSSVPGSVSFFNYVHSKGIKIFYVSNRSDSDVIVKSTMSNMHALGFPNTDTSDKNDVAHFLFQHGSISSKEGRRKHIDSLCTVILYLGDNLIDFDAAFDGTPANPTIRTARTDSLKNAWGDKYIVFPNAEYGDWEKALYDSGKYSSLSKEKQMRVRDLRSWDN